MKHYRVAIIGAGTAGLSARREVATVTDDYVVIDDGPLGTTCARVGCMPSKVLIQVANDFHRRHVFSGIGIRGGDSLSIAPKQVMSHVRSLRDRFVRSVMNDMETWRETRLIRRRARFVDQNTLDLGDGRLTADRIVIATGSKPIKPAAWASVENFLLDTDEFFELETLPEKVAVIGLGVIGIELGQALARLGVDVHGFTLDKAVGGLSDPALQDYAFRHFQSEFPITLHGVDKLESKGGRLLVNAGNERLEVDKAFTTMGRGSSVKDMGLEQLDLPLDEAGVPRFDPQTFRVADSPLFIAGDVTSDRPVLHEAADEGRIAGYNATRSSPECFRRRTRLGITFTDPNIASVGSDHKTLSDSRADFVTGEVSFEGQGRAIVKLKEKGLLHVYADRESGRLLGAEIFAPAGEHLAHLLSWAISTDLTARQALSLPFYHPVIEEGLRTALRQAEKQVAEPLRHIEVMRCQDPPVGCRA